ncbi:MAG TPA: hypothetical protein GXX28_01100 [Firmicutes bacterium]|nr:hypothetical protein [Bacillota bacterium]
MDRTAHQQVINDRISGAVEALLPHGTGTVTAHRLEKVLRDVAEVAFREGESYALLSLLTVDDVARELGVTPARVRALAKARHDRFGIGWQVPGSRTWLFRPEEIELLRPGRPGRPWPSREDSQ